jgi:putative ABC transport system substrate-binding protein
MDRRAFIHAVAASVVIAPCVLPAQPVERRFVIGWLGLATPESGATLLSAFKERLRDLGYVEGRNVAFELRWASGALERLPELAAELVRLPVDTIIATNNASIAATKRATATIPIVMVHAVDPVGNGLIASLARPGGNITGTSFDASREFMGKYLGIIKEIVPGLSRVGVLRQAESGSGTGSAASEAAAQKLKVTLEVVVIRSPDDIERAFATMIGKRVGAVIISGGPLTYMRRQQIADLALKNRLPSSHSLNEYAQAGLLFSYGPSLPDLYRRAAGYVDRILKGAKPDQLPVEQPSKFEFVINLKTAKALGLTIPQSLLLRADEVIR